MDFAIFTQAGAEMFGKWIHVLAGIIWIGTLYYFNFIQVPFFGETDASTKSNAIQKLVPRALIYFRHGAMLTFISGLFLLHQKTVSTGLGWDIFSTAWGPLIIAGGGLGTLMFLNVWLIIWPNQKIVIASTKGVAEGKAADPKAAGAGAWALVASRTNALFSIPMLFFMVGAAHLPLNVNPDRSVATASWVTIAIMLTIEANAVIFKKLGVLQKISNIWLLGFGLTAVMYTLIEILTK